MLSLRWLDSGCEGFGLLQSLCGRTIEHCAVACTTQTSACPPTYVPLQVQLHLRTCFNPSAHWRAPAGDPQRLLYGTDSYGFTCGMTHEFNGSTFNLADRKNLYYLEPLKLLSVSNIAFAKRVCASECPGSGDQCDALNTTSLPCTSARQYRCAAGSNQKETWAGAITGGRAPAGHVPALPGSRSNCCSGGVDGILAAYDMLPCVFSHTHTYTHIHTHTSAHTYTCAHTQTPHAQVHLLPPRPMRAQVQLLSLHGGLHLQFPQRAGRPERDPGRHGVVCTAWGAQPPQRPEGPGDRRREFRLLAALPMILRHPQCLLGQTLHAWLDAHMHVHSCTRMHAYKNACMCT